MTLFADFLTGVSASVILYSLATLAWSLWDERRDEAARR
jgi:hypothetical protein